MRVVVGLGNPGDRYRRTRHNVGFMVADVLAERADSPAWSGRDVALTTTARIGGQDAVLVKPVTFMNRSGLAVLEVLERHGAAPADVVVVFDDVALEPSAEA